MTSIVDSEAQFDLRLDQVNVPAPLRVALKEFGCEHHLLACLLLWPTGPANFE